MVRRINLVPVEKVVRRSGKYLVTTTYTPLPENVSNVFDYAKKLFEKYRIVTTITLEQIISKNKGSEPHYYLRVTQNRSISNADKSVKPITMYVCLDDGMVYISKNTEKNTPPQIINAAVQMLVNGLEYPVKTSRKRVD